MSAFQSNTEVADQSIVLGTRRQAHQLPSTDSTPAIFQLQSTSNHHWNIEFAHPLGDDNTCRMYDTTQRLLDYCATTDASCGQDLGTTEFVPLDDLNYTRVEELSYPTTHPNFADHRVGFAPVFSTDGGVYPGATGHEQNHTESRIIQEEQHNKAPAGFETHVLDFSSDVQTRRSLFQEEGSRSPHTISRVSARQRNGNFGCFMGTIKEFRKPQARKRYDDNRRDEIKRIRQLGACYACKLMKKSVSSPGAPIFGVSVSACG